MLKWLVAASLAGTLLLAGCANTSGVGGGLDTSDKQALAFCSTFSNAVMNLTMMRKAGMLSEGQIEVIDTAVDSIGPNCTQAIPPAPTAALISSLDILIAIQFLEE